MLPCFTALSRSYVTKRTPGALIAARERWYAAILSNHGDEAPCTIPTAWHANGFGFGPGHDEWHSASFSQLYESFSRRFTGRLQAAASMAVGTAERAQLQPSANVRSKSTLTLLPLSHLPVNSKKKARRCVWNSWLSQPDPLCPVLRKIMKGVGGAGVDMPPGMCAPLGIVVGATQQVSTGGVEHLLVLGPSYTRCEWKGGRTRTKTRNATTLVDR